MNRVRRRVTIFTSKDAYLNKYLVLFQQALSDYEVSIVTERAQLKQGDVAFYLSCYEIIDKQLLALHNNNIVIHESDLPLGKGWSPASWQILEGKKHLTLSLFEMAEKVDAGDIYFKDVVNLDGTELKDEWQEKIVHKKIEMCINFMTNYINKTPLKQSGFSTYYKRRTPEDCVLDINKPLIEQFNLLRIVDNDSYPAYFIVNGIKYKLLIEKTK